MIKIIFIATFVCYIFSNPCFGQSSDKKTRIACAVRIDEDNIIVKSVYEIDHVKKTARSISGKFMRVTIFNDDEIQFDSDILLANIDRISGDYTLRNKIENKIYSGKCQKSTEKNAF